MRGFRIQIGGSQYYWRSYYRSACEGEELPHALELKRKALYMWAKKLIEDDRQKVD